MKKFYDVNGNEIREHDILRYNPTRYERIVYMDEGELYILSGAGSYVPRMYLEKLEKENRLINYEIIGHVNW